MAKKITYNPKIRQIAKNLRKQGTLGEIFLWNCLKERKLKGFKFTRQKPIGNYVLDFLCPELLLAIETDGCSHDCKGDEDMVRQAEIEKMGIRFLRYEEREILQELDAVLEGISYWIEENVPAGCSLRVKKEKVCRKSRDYMQTAGCSAIRLLTQHPVTSQTSFVMCHPS